MHESSLIQAPAILMFCRALMGIQTSATATEVSALFSNMGTGSARAETCMPVQEVLDEPTELEAAVGSLQFTLGEAPPGDQATVGG
jgi:hypothetical protein